MKARVPPHSNDSEQAVLGGLMLAPSALSRLDGLLVENDFYRNDHRAIFRAISELDRKGSPCDAVTLGDWFDSNKVAEVVGGSSYVIQLANSTPSAANILGYAKVVREKSVLRQLIDAATDIAEDGFEPHGRGAQEVLDVAIQRLMALQRVEKSCEYTAKAAVKLAYDALAAAATHGGAVNTVPTGLTDIDSKLGGLHRGDLIVVGGRAAMGKTAFLVNLARHAAKCGHAIGIVSGEQSAAQLVARMMAVAGNVTASKFRTGRIEEDEWPRVTDAVTEISKARAWILDRSSPSIAEVQRVARRWKQEHGIEALYVDYLQRIRGPGDRRWEAVGAVAQGLKDLARDLDIPVIVLAQVSRAVESGGKGREPRLGDLSDSSEIEKEADQVLMLYRDEYYNPDSPQRGIAKIIIEKNRHGPTGFVEVAWVAESMRFANLGFTR